jgi:YggT family protein
MTDTLSSGLLFLTTTIIDLYLFVLVIRLMLAFVGANYFNPLTQGIIKVTDFIIKPMRRFIPNVRRIEVSTLVLIIFLEMCKFFFIALFSMGVPNIIGLFILAIGGTTKLLIDAMFYAILFQAILSFIQPMSPINYLLQQFTSPIMRPIQRFVPPIGGFDISPIPAMIGLQLLTILLVNPIMSAGLGVAY